MASPILSALARKQIRSAGARQFRQYATARTASRSANMEGFTRRITGTMMMYVPVVAAVMFWPYAIQPIMDWKEGVHKS